MFAELTRFGSVSMSAPVLINQSKENQGDLESVRKKERIRMFESFCQPRWPSKSDISSLVLITSNVLII
ncbi:hypothetical protein CEXT_362651 [Caerostris extrusa]|uniref:Ycf15 n=1 Tax=Caerostris extrusa TaxID=172846 RepID=A0AAV4XCM1_CAEEX|nr:hypothetical protein CEXT_362651 [Caerostris extrusa]